MINFGDVPSGTVLYIPFATYDGAGASVTMTGFAVTDIEIYKNGSTTQRASDNGYTLLDTDGTDFDGITGIHGFSVDTSDNSTAGFYAVGSQYFVVVSSVTVSGQTVNFIAATFRIRAAETVAGTPAVDVTVLGGLTSNGNKLARFMAGCTIFTADSGGTTSFVDASLTTSDADYYKGHIVLFTNGTLQGQARLITGFDPATDTITFTPATTQAVSTHDYIILPFGQVDAPTANQNADALLDRSNGVETGYTVRALLRLLGASISKLSGAGSGTEVFRNMTDSKARITATVDSDGNRTAVTLDPS